MESEREELDGLIRSGGWTHFCAYVAREWGSTEGGGVQFLNAVKAAASETADADATAKLRQIVVAQREIHKLMAWGPERLKHLAATEPKANSDAVPMSRRGGL